MGLAVRSGSRDWLGGWRQSRLWCFRPRSGRRYSPETAREDRVKRAHAIRSTPRGQSTVRARKPNGFWKKGQNAQACENTNIRPVLSVTDWNKPLASMFIRATAGCFQLVRRERKCLEGLLIFPQGSFTESARSGRGPWLSRRRARCLMRHTHLIQASAEHLYWSLSGAMASCPKLFEISSAKTGNGRRQRELYRASASPIESWIAGPKGFVQLQV